MRGGPAFHLMPFCPFGYLLFTEYTLQSPSMEQTILIKSTIRLAGAFVMPSTLPPLPCDEIPISWCLDPFSVAVTK